MGQKRKPSNKEMVQVINGLIRETITLRKDLHTMAGTLDMYIEFKNDADEFSKCINDKIKQEAENDVQKNAEVHELEVEGNPSN